MLQRWFDTDVPSIHREQKGDWSDATPPDISAQVYLIPCANTSTWNQVDNSLSHP